MPPHAWATAARHLGLLAAALPTEALCGYPDALFRAVRHPVVWIGALIGALDRAWNQPTFTAATRRALGLAAILIVAALPAIAAALVQTLLLRTLPLGLGWPPLVLAATPFLAQRSLHTHVAAVASGLRADGLAGGRAAVSHIVGRNPATLDEAGVVRAAVESLAENFSDGVVAPAFWGVVAGLPGLVAYKAINTADSMIGHRTPRHEAFGWAAARLDDLVNLPASRLAALWLVLAATLHHHTSATGALRAVWRDAGRHRSPNAGWPEAAMAGALGVRLAGPRTYGQTRVNDAWMGADGRAATPHDLDRALALYRTACAIEIVVAAGLWLLIAPG